MKLDSFAFAIIVCYLRSEIFLNYFISYNFNIKIGFSVHDIVYYLLCFLSYVLTIYMAFSKFVRVFSVAECVEILPR